VDSQRSLNRYLKFIPISPSRKALINMRGYLCAVCVVLTVASALGQTRGFLKVTVVEGEGAFNDMKTKVGHPPVVQVRDESNELVSGAEVEFTFPVVGAGGTFSDGQRTMKATTNATGIATAGSFRPNLNEGRFNISVTARYQGKQGTLLVTQSNTLASSGAKGSNKKIWIIVGIVAGAGAGAAVALSGHSGSGSAAVSPPTSLTIGGVTVGGPR
jgi:hypothetical protein